MITYRTMRPEDISAGLSLCRLAGWNQLSRDWRMFLELNSDGCLVALDNSGNVVGTVATVPYGDHLSWIGMVLVHPANQRQGIGKQLLKEALRLLNDKETIKLDATPEGREVYLKLNFIDEYQIDRMHRPALPIDRHVTTGARAMCDMDLPVILKLDSIVFGADRKYILERNFETTPQYAFVVEEHGTVKGFCLGRPGHNFDHIGPVVAQGAEYAFQLLLAVLQQAEGKEIIVDALDHTPEWTRFLSSLGFAPLRPLIRMYRGPNLYPGIPKNQFAILGPEFG